MLDNYGIFGWVHGSDNISMAFIRINFGQFHFKNLMLADDCVLLQTFLGETSAHEDCNWWKFKKKSPLMECGGLVMVVQDFVLWGRSLLWETLWFFVFYE